MPQIQYLVEFQSQDGQVYAGAVKSVLKTPSPSFVQIVVQTPLLMSGRVLGRIYLQDKASSARTVTLSIFDIKVMDEQAGVAWVEWASSTRGSVSGQSSVQVKLVGFPMIDDLTQVKTKCCVFEQGLF
jgi:hypothetical protein